MWLGDKAHSQAVLPAFVLGLALSSHFAGHRQEQQRLRVVAFAFLTPFFFVKGGMNVSVSALWATVIAQRFLQPDAETERHNDERGLVTAVADDMTHAEEVTV